MDAEHERSQANAPEAQGTLTQEISPNTRQPAAAALACFWRSEDRISVATTSQTTVSIFSRASAGKPSNATPIKMLPCLGMILDHLAASDDDGPTADLEAHPDHGPGWRRFRDERGEPARADVMGDGRHRARGEAELDLVRPCDAQSAARGGARFDGQTLRHE